MGNRESTEALEQEDLGEEGITGMARGTKEHDLEDRESAKTLKQEDIVVRSIGMVRGLYNNKTLLHIINLNIDYFLFF
jgi:hypothetical protein